MIENQRRNLVTLLPTATTTAATTTTSTTTTAVTATTTTTTSAPVPVNCQWGQWGQWQPCTATCGGGTKERTRAETLQAANGGIACLGSSIETSNCNQISCPGIKEDAH